MKNKKIIILLICLFITGCRAECIIKINGEKIEENLYYIIDKNKLIKDDISINFSNDIKEYFVVKDTVEGFIVNKKTGYSNTEDAYELSNNYSSFNEFSQSLLLTSCYDLAKISKYDDESYNITTSNIFKCFDIYNELDKIDIIIETNNNVLYSNSDKKEGNKYIWNINKNNYNDKKISITISKKSNETEIENKKNQTNIIIIICSVFSVIGLVIAFIAIRNKQVNKI